MYHSILEAPWPKNGPSIDRDDPYGLPKCHEPISPWVGERDEVGVVQSLRKAVRDTGAALTVGDETPTKNTWQRRAVIGTNLDTGEVKRFDSIADTRALDFTPAIVGLCCRGSRPAHKRWAWRYEDEKAD